MLGFCLSASLHPLIIDLENRDIGVNVSEKGSHPRVAGEEEDLMLL